MFNRDKGEVDFSTKLECKEVEGNDEADHAIHGVKKKLKSLLSVTCQVQELINCAIDPKNLCLMYPGWQPWL
jgi:phosphatidylinositol kinase/protein kinase (PI-3  family)